MRLELRIEGYVGINRELEKGMYYRRNSMCRVPVAAKSRECSGNAKKSSVFGV